MSTRIMIRNIEAQTKEADETAADITVRATGGGKAETQVLIAGEEAIFEVGDGRKVTVSEGDDT